MKKNIFFIISIVILSVTLSTIGCNKKPENENPLPFLCPITHIEGEAFGNKILVKWEAPSCGSVISYKLYRNDTLYKTLTDTSFSEEVYSTGSYSYCVSVVYADGESEKACTFLLITNVPTGDGYAEIIKGEYVGDVVIPDYEEHFTNKTVTLKRGHPNNTNITAIEINDSISVMNTNIPFNIKKSARVFLEPDSSYVFSFETSTTIEYMGQPLLIPLLGEGKVTGNILTLNITAQIMDQNVLGIFTGVKQ